MKQFLIALDQLVNTMLFFLPGGVWADETFSARCWRCMPRLASVIDAILFFDPEHCRMSYLSERQRLQLPPDER